MPRPRELHDLPPMDPDDDYDPIEEAEPVAPLPSPDTYTPEDAAEWNALPWSETESGKREDRLTQRYRSADGRFGKVVFDFPDGQPPSQETIARAAGTRMRLHTTQVVGRRITAFYCYQPPE